MWASTNFTRHLIFIFLLLAGCLIIVVSRTTARAPRQTPGDDEYVIPLVVVDGKSGFVEVGSACGNGFISLHKSLDGVEVCWQGGTYSPRVRRSIQAVLRGAIVIEDGPDVDGDGEVLRERTVFFYSRKDGRQAAAIFTTSPAYSGFSLIEGLSLEHVLSFERLYVRH